VSLLAAEGVSLAFGGRRVLDEIDLCVESGECLAILGRTGSGKTTLISILAGLRAPDAGAIWMKGERITGPALDRGVVFQHDCLLPWMTAEANVDLAVQSAFPRESRHARARRVAAALALVRLGGAGDKLPAMLSGGMRQRVSIARAFAMEPDLLLMDEPFSAVDALTRAELQNELARILRETRRTIVIVTSDLDEALLLANRIVVLRDDGSLSEPFDPPADFLKDRDADGFDEARAALREMLQGQGDALSPGRRERARAPSQRERGDVLLEFDNVSKRFFADASRPPAVEEISFALREREFLSIVGHSGCGKSTILSMIAGLTAPSAGAIRIRGAPVEGPGADRAMAFQSPALLPWLSARDNIGLGVDQAFGDRPKSERDSIVARALERLDLCEVADQMPCALSAGARQRLGVARAVALEPRLLLLDEPFAGLDTLTRQGLQSVMAKLCRDAGVAAILVTHDIDEALALSDRILLMTDGPRARIGEIVEVASGDRHALRRRILRFLEENAHPSHSLAEPPREFENQ
jgi:nitrate/nitrite transport system ATP-binding protein